MADQFENKIIDKRVVRRYIQKGLLSDSAFDNYLNNLPDLESEALAVDAEVEEEGLGG